MFKLRKIASDRKDGTSPYILEVSEGTTFADFIKYGIEHCDKDFGTINFGTKFQESDSYKYSNFKDSDFILRLYGHRLIKGPIKCDGGPIQMNYWIELVDDLEGSKNVRKSEQA